jgi:hypothetical protein
MAKTIALTKEQLDTISNVFKTAITFVKSGSDVIKDVTSQVNSTVYEGKHDLNAPLETKLENIMATPDKVEVNNADVLRAMSDTPDISHIVNPNEMNITPTKADLVYDTVTTPVEGTPDLMGVVNRGDVQNSSTFKYDGMNIDELLAETTRLRSRLVELRAQNNDFENQIGNILNKMNINMKYDANYDFDADDKEIDDIVNKKLLNSTTIEVLDGEIAIINNVIKQKCLKREKTSAQSLDIPLGEAKPVFESQPEVVTNVPLGEEPVIPNEQIEGQTKMMGF